jgi:hypothetical protein
MMKKAVESTAIVTSLFPSNVRDRLYKEQEEQHTRRTHGIMKSYSINDTIGLSSSAESQRATKPLADLYAESTVLVRTMTLAPANYRHAHGTFGIVFLTDSSPRHFLSVC